MEEAYTINYQLEYISTYVKHNFLIYDISKVIPKSSAFKIKDIKDVISEIDSYHRTTGIMIGNFSITENHFLFFLIFDNHAIILYETQLQQFQQFFKNFSDKTSLFFLNSKCEKKIHNIGVQNTTNINNDQIQLNFQRNICEQIREKIIDCIIRKSQIRTQKRHFEPMSEKITINKDDFCPLLYFTGKPSIWLCFNSKDQYLYVLKMFDKNNPILQNQYNHEISFYTESNNENPFICRFYGSCEISRKKAIVIEYIEGQTLKEYIEKEGDKLERSEKMKIIFQIMSAIEYMHLNNYIYRDLKYDNIMIDSKGNAVLIDFDQAKNNDGKEMTGNIGSSYFSSPEQKIMNTYSFETDIYSLGIIIHFILNKKLLRENNNDHHSIMDTEFSNDYYDKYKKCFEVSPELRPSIVDIFNSLLEIEMANEKKSSNKLLFLYLYQLREKLYLSKNKHQSKKEITSLRNFIGHYYCFYYNNEYFENEPIIQNINKGINYLTESIKQNDSEAQCILGIIYYFCEYVPRDINKAIQYFTLSANQNNSDAQFFLGRAYYENIYVPQDINKSIHYFTLSANQNNSEAQCFLGYIYYENKNVPRDINKSIHYFTLSANQNNSEAQKFLGYIYYENKDVPRDINKSILYFTLSASQNNSEAQYFLGQIYYENKYVPRDINKSIHYLTLLANQNDSDAQQILGHIYYENKYIPRDINKSIHYFTLSANQNDSGAQYMLAFIYFMLIFASADINKAIYYLNLLANQKNAYAQFFLGIIYSIDKNDANFIIEKHIFSNYGFSFNSNEYLFHDINKAIHYLILSADQNFSDAQLMLGKIYFSSPYIPQDIGKSIYYLTLSSEQNNSFAQYQLGQIYYDGKYIQRDMNKAIHYLILSADQHNQFAQQLLGKIYYYGKYVPQDIKKAIHYLTLSANQYNSDAQCLLGYIYYNDKYVSRDIKKAIYYFNLSAYQGDSFAQYKLGKIYYSGKYVNRNIKKAIFYLTLSANQNDSDSNYLLGKIYNDGKYTSRDINMAIHYFKESACFRNSHAKNNLGILYKNGDGISKNISQAIEYFGEAIKEENDPFSLLNLARIYYFGIDVECNIPKSIDLLETIATDSYYVSFFLYFIYTFGNERYLDKNKSMYYRNKIGNLIIYTENLILLDFHESDFELILKQRIESFFKEYDFVYSDSKDESFDFISYLYEGSYQAQEEEKLHESRNIKEINEKFYEGFYS